jgi:DNA-binding beta-propeller fold protein YncE
VRRAAQRQRRRLAGLAGVAAAALIAVAIPAGLGVVGQLPRPQKPPAAPTLYVYAFNAPGEGTVTPVNTATGTPGKPIRVAGLAVRVSQLDGDEIVFTPDGKTAYVTTESGTPHDVRGHYTATVTPISTATGTPGKPIHIPGRNFFDRSALIAITPDGKTAYVSYPLSPTITPINTATNTPGKPINIPGQNPYVDGPIVFTPDGETAYVLAGSGVTPISTTTGTPGKPIHIGDGRGIVITPDGKTAYVTSRPGVTPISTATNKPGKPISIRGGFARGIAITPDGKTVYVSTESGCVGGPPDCTFTVTPISTATNTPGTPIHIGYGPQDCTGQIAITPDGKTAYALTAWGVIPISTATGTPGQPIKAGAGTPEGCYQIAFTPDGKTAYITSEGGVTGVTPGGSPGVTPVNTATGKPGEPIHGIGTSIQAIAVTP